MEHGDRGARPKAISTSVTVVGALMLVVGLLFGGAFLWSAPALVRAVEDAAQTGHLTLGLLAVLCSGDAEFGGSLVGGLGAVLLTVAGLLLLRSRDGTRPESDGRQPRARHANAQER